MLVHLWIEYVPHIYYSGFCLMLFLTLKVMSSEKKKLTIGRIIALLVLSILSWAGLFLAAYVYKLELKKKKRKV